MPQRPFLRTRYARYGYSRSGCSPRLDTLPLLPTHALFSISSLLRSSVGSTTGESHDEGWRRLYRGTSHALYGISNDTAGSCDTRRMKGQTYEHKRRHFAKLGRAWTAVHEELVRPWRLPLRPNSPIWRIRSGLAHCARRTHITSSALSYR